MNAVELEVVITRKKLTKRSLAKALGISEQALYNKLRKMSDFKAKEVATLKETLGLSDKECAEIFFGNV